MSRARLASLLAIGCIIALSLSLCLIAPAAAQHEDEADDNEPAGDEQDEPATSTAAPLKHHHHLHVHKKGDTTPKAGHSRASDEVLREASEAMGPGVRISKEALRSGLAKSSTAKPKAGKADEPEASSGEDEHEAEGSRFGLGKFWRTSRRPPLPPRAPSTTSKAPSTTSKAPSTTSKKPSNTSKAPSSGKQLAALDEEDDSKDSEEDYTDEGEYKARVCVTTTTKSPTTTTTSAPRNTTTTTRWPRIYPVKTTRRGGYIINR